MKRVLVLGAGLVARPLVRYLLSQPGFHVRVASRTVARAQELIAGSPNGEALAFDIGDAVALSALVAGCDLAISLLPYVYHVQVARACLARRKHLVTTSYVSPAMRELDAPARAAGVLLLNEVGLDPGIDHMSAMRIIHRVQRAGGEIAGFTSMCGGLPAPEANTNPFGYKFSWSPRGVLLAGRNSARFRRDGQTVEIPGKELFDHCWRLPIAGLGDFEGYPNRDSLPYLDTYGIGGARDMLRGTLRNLGWCSTLKRIVELGLLDEGERPELAGATWGQTLAGIVGAGGGGDVRRRVAGYLGIAADAPELERLEWLGLFGAEPVPAGAHTLLDALVMQMQARMAYAPGERDMIILQHTFNARYPDRAERITSTLAEFGVPGGDTAMARTVSLPAAIAVRLVLEGKLGLAGVHIPVRPEIYMPIMDELESLGVYFAEQCRGEAFGS